IEVLKHELIGIRTGKANPGLLEGIRVLYYGQTVPLKQVANIAVPEPRLITIHPWEKSLVPEIEKAVRSSELGLNPQIEGVIIRLPIPPLTEERRKELVKVVKKHGEETRVAVRNVRRDTNERFKKLEKEHKISEDELHARQEEVQKMTDRYIKLVDEVLEVKEKEILEV
ncbi:MAG: frr, partial [Candidatus Krumholzibacteriota bacterium]|nr:frr [Candidatus Krumholzibacteriota bacterium]